MELFFSSKVVEAVGSLEVLFSVKRADLFSFARENSVFVEDKLEEDECEVESEFGEREDSVSFDEEDPVFAGAQLMEDECEVESELPSG